VAGAAQARGTEPPTIPILLELQSLSRSKVVLLPPGHLFQQVGPKSEQEPGWGPTTPRAGLSILRAEVLAGWALSGAGWLTACPGQGSTAVCSAPGSRDPALGPPSTASLTPRPRVQPAPASPWHQGSTRLREGSGSSVGPQRGVCHCREIYEQFINVFYRQLLVCAEQYSFCQGKL